AAVARGQTSASARDAHAAESRSRHEADRAASTSGAALLVQHARIGAFDGSPRSRTRGGDDRGARRSSPHDDAEAARRDGQCAIDPSGSSRDLRELPEGDANSYGAATALYDRYSRRSEEHTSELQSRENLVCRLLLE